MGCHTLLQGIFLIQGSSPDLIVGVSLLSEPPGKPIKPCISAKLELDVPLHRHFRLPFLSCCSFCSKHIFCFCSSFSSFLSNSYPYVESRCISQLYLLRVLATVSYFPLCFFCLWCIYQFKNFIVVFSELLSIALLVYKLPVVSVRMGFPAFLYI